MTVEIGSSLSATVSRELIALQTLLMRVLPHGTHYSAKSVEAIWIKCLA